MSLAAVIIPVGLFLTFSSPSEPHISREFSMGTVEWNFTRPNYYISKQIPIAELVTNSYKDDIAAVKFDIFVSSYFEEEPLLGDYIIFKIAFSANLTTGFIYRLHIRFSSIDNDAYLNIIFPDSVDEKIWLETHNLSTPTVRDSYSTNLPYINTMAVGRPNNCYLKMMAFWYFSDKNNVDHGSTATADLILYNESEYVKIQIPMNLKILAS